VRRGDPDAIVAVRLSRGFIYFAIRNISEASFEKDGVMSAGVNALK
jgi:hypothetical protein